MRSISILALPCLAVLACPAIADDTFRPDPHANPLNIRMANPDTAFLQARADDPRAGRLSYLYGSSCANTGGCAAAVSGLSLEERNYIKSLNLGTYGPMDVRFTGDRVKLKVRF